MTWLASSANVLATMPPQPRSNDRAITLPFVPGGPDPSTNGLSNFMPLTVMLRSVTSPPGCGCREPETAGLAQPESQIQPYDVAPRPPTAERICAVLACERPALPWPD